MRRATRSALFIDSFHLETFTQVDFQGETDSIKSLIFQNDSALLLTDKGELLKIYRLTETENSNQSTTGFTTIPCGPMPEFHSMKIRAITCNANAVLAIGEEGTLYSWGNDPEGTGILGLGSVKSRTTPTVVLNNIKFRSISLSTKHASAIDERGNLYTWGTGKLGELCDPKETYFCRPTHIESPYLLSSQTSVAYKNLTAIITSGGNLVFFGQFIPEIKLQQKDFKPQLIQLGSKGFVVEVAVGDRFAAFLTRKGELYLVGEHFAYQKINVSLTFKSLLIKNYKLFALTTDGKQLFEWDYGLKMPTSPKSQHTFLSENASSYRVTDLSDEFTKNPSFAPCPEASLPVILFEPRPDDNKENKEIKEEFEKGKDVLLSPRGERRLRVRFYQTIGKGKPNGTSSYLERAVSQEPFNSNHSTLELLKTETKRGVSQQPIKNVKDQFFELDFSSKSKETDNSIIKTKNEDKKRKVLEILDFSNSKDSRDRISSINSSVASTAIKEKAKRIDNIQRALQLQASLLKRNLNNEGSFVPTALNSTDTPRGKDATAATAEETYKTIDITENEKRETVQPDGPFPSTQEISESQSPQLHIRNFSEISNPIRTEDNFVIVKMSILEPDPTANPIIPANNSVVVNNMPKENKSPATLQLERKQTFGPNYIDNALYLNGSTEISSEFNETLVVKEAIHKKVPSYSGFGMFGHPPKTTRMFPNQLQEEIVDYEENKTKTRKPSFFQILDNIHLNNTQEIPSSDETRIKAVQPPKNVALHIPNFHLRLSQEESPFQELHPTSDSIREPIDSPKPFVAHHNTQNETDYLQEGDTQISYRAKNPLPFGNAPAPIEVKQELEGSIVLTTEQDEDSKQSLKQSPGSDSQGSPEMNREYQEYSQKSYKHVEGSYIQHHLQTIVEETKEIGSIEESTEDLRGRLKSISFQRDDLHFESDKRFAQESGSRLVSPRFNLPLQPRVIHETAQFEEEQEGGFQELSKMQRYSSSILVQGEEEEDPHTFRRSFTSKEFKTNNKEDTLSLHNTETNFSHSDISRRDFGGREKMEYSMGSIETSAILPKPQKDDSAIKNKEKEELRQKEKKMACAFLVRSLKKKLQKELLSAFISLVNWEPREKIPRENIFQAVYYLEKFFIQHNLPLKNWAFFCLAKPPKDPRETALPLFIRLESILKRKLQSFFTEFSHRAHLLDLLRIKKQRQEAGLASIHRFFASKYRENALFAINLLKIHRINAFKKQTRQLLADRIFKLLVKAQKQHCLLEGFQLTKIRSHKRALLFHMGETLENLIISTTYSNKELSFSRIKFVAELKKTLLLKLGGHFAQKLVLLQQKQKARAFESIYSFALDTIQQEKAEKMSKVLLSLDSVVHELKSQVFRNILTYAYKKPKKEKINFNMAPLAILLIRMCSRTFKDSFYAIKEFSIVNKLNRQRNLQAYVLRQISSLVTRKHSEACKTFFENLRIFFYIEESSLQTRNQEFAFKFKILDTLIQKLISKAKASGMFALKQNRIEQIQLQTRKNLAVYLRTTIERLYKKEIREAFSALSSLSNTRNNTFILKSSRQNSAQKSPVTPTSQINIDTNIFGENFLPKREESKNLLVHSPNFKVLDTKSIISANNVAPLISNEETSRVNNISCEHSFGDLSKIINDRTKIRIEIPDINLDDNDKFSKSQSLVSLHDRFPSAKNLQNIDIFNLSISKTIDSVTASPVSSKKATERELYSKLVNNGHSARSTKKSTPRAGYFTRAFNNPQQTMHSRVSSLPEMLTMGNFRSQSEVPEMRFNLDPPDTQRSTDNMKKSKSLANFQKKKQLIIDDGPATNRDVHKDEKQNSAKRVIDPESLKKLREGYVLSNPNDSVEEFRPQNEDSAHVGAGYAEPFEIETKPSTTTSSNNVIPQFNNILPELEHCGESPEQKHNESPKGHVYGTKIFPFPQYLKKLEKEGRMSLKKSLNTSTPKGSIKNFFVSSAKLNKSGSGLTSPLESVHRSLTPNNRSEIQSSTDQLHPTKSNYFTRPAGSKFSSATSSQQEFIIPELQIPKAEISLEAYVDSSSSNQLSSPQNLFGSRTPVSSIPTSKTSTVINSRKPSTISRQTSVDSNPTRSLQSVVSPNNRNQPKPQDRSKSKSKTPIKESTPNSRSHSQSKPTKSPTAASQKANTLSNKPKPSPTRVKSKSKEPENKSNTLPANMHPQIMKINTNYYNSSNLTPVFSESPREPQVSESFEQYKARKGLGLEIEIPTSPSPDALVLDSGSSGVQSQIEKRLLEEEKYSTLYNMYKTKDPYRARLYQDMARQAHGRHDHKGGFDQLRAVRTPGSTTSQHSAFMTFAQQRTPTEQSRLDTQNFDFRERFEEIKDLYNSQSYFRIEQAKKEYNTPKKDGEEYNSRGTPVLRDSNRDSSRGTPRSSINSLNTKGSQNGNLQKTRSPFAYESRKENIQF